jgi:hypothetical protein
LIFQPDEKTVDEIVHQGLRTEADGQSGNARARQQGARI